MFNQASAPSSPPTGSAGAAVHGDLGACLGQPRRSRSHKPFLDARIANTFPAKPSSITPVGQPGIYRNGTAVDEQPAVAHPLLRLDGEDLAGGIARISWGGQDPAVRFPTYTEFPKSPAPILPAPLMRRWFTAPVPWKWNGRWTTAKSTCEQPLWAFLMLAQ